MNSAVDTIIAIIQKRMSNGKTPVLIALDGGSGAGKTTLALMIANRLNATVIHMDDFYAAQIPTAEWEARTSEQRAADVIDWRRLRAEALGPLLAGKSARWHAFDFESLHHDGSYPLRTDWVEVPPADVILLDGAYSSRPELADMIDLSVLVDVPIAVRHARLAARESSHFLESWHALWDVVEGYYFTDVRPKESFDVVVTV